MLPTYAMEPVIVLNRDVLKGAIFGAAIGDALGGFTEFGPYVHDKSTTLISCKEMMKGHLVYYPHLLRTSDDFSQSDRERLKNLEQARLATSAIPLMYTDDTAMAILVMDVLIQAKQKDWTLEKTMRHMALSFIKDMDNNKGWMQNWRAPGNACVPECTNLVLPSVTYSRGLVESRLPAGRRVGVSYAGVSFWRSFL